MLTTFLHALYTFSAIAVCLLIGNGLNHFVGGLPASLYGMVLFAFTLKIKLFNAQKIQDTIKWIISHMGVCFVPAGVGIMNHFDLLKQQGVSIILIVIVTTLFLIAFIGLSHKYYLSKQ